MPRLSLFFIIAIVASAQSLLFPRLSFFGSPLPLVMICLTLVSFKKVDSLPWLGLGAGLSIDITIGSSLGIWTLYYLAICLLLRWLLHRPKVHWWWRVTWVGGSVIVAPVYTQLLTGQIQLRYWPEIILLPALILASIVAIPCWLVRGQQP